jgi:hypothetical protein
MGEEECIYPWQKNSDELLGSIKVSEFFSSCTTGSFSRKAHFLGVSYTHLDPIHFV